MKHILKHIFFVFVILALAALAFAPALAFAESISVSASAARANVGDTIYISAAYANNSQAIRYATCTFGGPILSGTVDMPYAYESGNYVYGLYLSKAGTYTSSVSCSKAGYNSVSDSITLEVLKASSTLSVGNTQSSAEIGSTINVPAYYQHDYSKISGAACTLDASPPSGSKTATQMVDAGGYYSAYYTISAIGTYSFAVSCTSDNYASQSRSFNVAAKKHDSLLHGTMTSSYYAEQPITAPFSYTASQNGGIISGAQCRYELNRGGTFIKGGTLAYSSPSYVLSLDALDASTNTYDVKVFCQSSNYASAETTQSFYVNNIPAFITLNKEAPNGDFSHAPISITSRYVNSNTNQEIYGADCGIDALSENIDTADISRAIIDEAGQKINMELPAADTEKSLRIKGCCSKKNYANACGELSVSVSPQPISMETLPEPSEFISGEKYVLGVRANPANHGNASDITCSADVEFAKGGLQAKRLILARNDVAHSSEIVFEKPGQWNIKYSCFGEGYIKQYLDINIRTKMFNKESENNLIAALSALGIILAAAVILIKKKYAAQP